MLKITLIFFISLLAIVLVSCDPVGNSGRFDDNTTTVYVDSIRDIKLTFPDSSQYFGYKKLEKISQYLENTEKFNIDTVSLLSPTSIALDKRAQELKQKLIKILPVVSLTTGIGENKFTRKYYVVEGDMKLDRDELFFYSLKRLQNQKIDTNNTEKSKDRKFTVAIDLNGNPAVWPNGTTIKYCIMRSSFSSKSLYDSTVKTMKKATADWMKVCNIKFQYLPKLDKQEFDLETYPEPILFIVRQINVSGAFIAQAFYPTDPKYMRILYLDNTFFTSPYNKAGIVRHELGHVLGFRHEHIWSSDNSCQGEKVIEESLGAYRTTEYDPYSVMHYPCGLNKDNTLLELTSFDKEGARKIYPFNK